MNQINNCPNCHAELKSGLMSNIKLLSAQKAEVINTYHDQPSAGYCTKCGKELYEAYKLQMSREQQEVQSKLEALISAIPVISAHTPQGWTYDVLNMVTGQSTTGTGVISEFTSSITDLLGMQSGRHNQKLKAGEDLCFSQLRKQTLDQGGNAIIATDIDYSELGASKGMIMVCMAGTAVKLQNLEVLGTQRAEQLEALLHTHVRHKALSKYTLESY
jgi:uncharacterized protein YbjQ (UPF0145 family)